MCVHQPCLQHLHELCSILQSRNPLFSMSPQLFNTNFLFCVFITIIIIHYVVYQYPIFKQPPISFNISKTSLYILFFSIIPFIKPSANCYTTSRIDLLLQNYTPSTKLYWICYCPVYIISRTSQQSYEHKTSRTILQSISSTTYLYNSFYWPPYRLPMRASSTKYTYRNLHQAFLQVCHHSSCPCFSSWFIII